MQENLVIVESPAKAKTIEKFLGKEYKVMSSYGHIRDLKRKELSIDMNTMEPCYEIPEEKQKLVGELRNQASKAGKIWLASDEDREGEAISWHLCEVLGLDESRTNRIVFHEITKPAILEAIKMPRTIDLNLVNAQQARRVLDRLVGFNLSPVLWRKVKPSLSAGRVQSVAVRLIVEREREIHHFKSEPFYRINAIFTLTDKEGTLKEIKTELNVRFGTREEATAFLEKCKKATFTVGNVTKKPLRRSPAPPFTTSTLQQEAARKLGFTVSQTMMVAQHLYENGYITYMRTDSVNLSSLCRNAGKEEIVKLYGENYSKPRTYHTKAKGAQEAHEAIRPTYMNNPQIEGTQQERRLYELIWKRTLACQMDDARIEKTTAEIFISGTDEIFVANGEVVTFDGFLKVYKESTDDDQESRDGMTNQLPAMKKGDVLQMDEMTATERYSMCPARYTEASLVHKLEELGIGRPSTYAPTIQTIQQREYVVKGDQKGEERTYTIDVLKGDKITMKTKKELVGSEKGKLLPTDIGMVVNDFLTEHFKEIMDYNFTAKVEQQFDKIAEGKKEWTSVIRNFYKDFEPAVKETLNRRSEHKAGDKLLGTDPQTGKPVFAKIGKYGSVVQIGTADDQEKPRFAQIPNGLSMETMTLEDALELFKLPRTVGEYEGKDVVIGIGRFGPYVLHDKKYVSLPKEEDPMRVTLQTAVGLIVQKRFQEKKRHLKQFEENADLEILDGRYGPYIAFEGKNYRLPKKLHDRIDTITYQQCMEIIEATPVKKK
ncbi:MAG: type I DNA topoisomerase [Prevotellaceae bacterium]|nr:type I DNA topoisomerase [Prevotellaceae bacterium]MDY2633048.1 type I DNA topoisomerase [Prevotella sp.]